MEFVREGSVMIIEFDDVTCLKFINVEITLIVVTWFYREIEAKWVLKFVMLPKF